MVAFSTPNFPPPCESFAIDFETSYVKGVRDIGTLGTVPYLRHAETDIYLVSIYGHLADGTVVSYSGPLEGAPWHLIDGKHWVSHNASFDAAVFMEAKSRGQIPAEVGPLEWDCTSSLAAYLGACHSLGPSKRSGSPGAAAVLLSETVDKGVRDEMSGKQWATMTPEFREQATAYALKDAELCFRLWDGYHAEWPAQEVAISRHTTAMGLTGVCVDLPFIEQGIATLKTALWHAEQRIPWVGQLDAKGKEYTVGSKKGMREACVAANIPPPISTADKNEAYDKWIAQYEEQAPFVRAVKDHRSLERTLDVLEKFRGRTLESGRMPYGLKYGGAHTLRWSGDGGLNLHNLTKELLTFDDQWRKVKPKKGETYRAQVDLRGGIVPAPGKKFIIADLKQIEARVTLWFAEDWAQLELLRNGMDVYEAHARATMGYTRPEKLEDWVKTPGLSTVEAQLRQIAKARVLGLGFGMGHVRLIDYAKAQLGLVLTVPQAKAIVNGFRRANPGIVRLWNRLQAAMEGHAVSADRDQPFRIELPSWRSLEYYDVSQADGLKARDEIGGRLTHWFGGKLLENLVQATARDILAEAILRIDAAYPGSVVLHVHDEVICEVDLDVPVSAIHAMMTVTPEWAPGLPVGSSAEEADRYFK